MVDAVDMYIQFLETAKKSYEKESGVSFAITMLNYHSRQLELDNELPAEIRNSLIDSFETIGRKLRSVVPAVPQKAEYNVEEVLARIEEIGI